RPERFVRSCSVTLLFVGRKLLRTFRQFQISSATIASMAARAIGTGTISFGLVSIPVKLYTATASEAVSFNLIHKKCKGRIKQQIFCPTDNEIVERNDLVKGFECAKNQYVLFSEEELDALEAAKTNSLEIVEFVPAE